MAGFSKRQVNESSKSRPVYGLLRGLAIWEFCEAPILWVQARWMEDFMPNPPRKAGRVVRALVLAAGWGAGRSARNDAGK